MSEKIIPPDKKVFTKQIMIWVGSATAILSLIFGMQQLYTSIITNNKVKTEVRNIIHSSQVLAESKEYSQAWELLVQADQYGIMKDDIDYSKVNVAFHLLRNMHSNEKLGSFTEQTEKLLPTLSDASLKATNQYLADIYAHLGWAQFLRLRDGNFDLDPEFYYNKALAIDSGNVYANTMAGYWLYWQKKDIDRAFQYFQIAAKSDRDLPYVRQMQFAALMSYDFSNIDILKLLYTMRINEETIEEDMAITCLKINYLGIGFERFRDALVSGEIVKSSISPKEDLTLFEWLWNSYPDFTEDYQKYKPFIQALLSEATGDKMSASTSYNQLYAELPDSNPTIYEIDTYLQNAIKRTGSNK